MGAKVSVLRLIMSFPHDLSSAMLRFPIQFLDQTLFVRIHFGVLSLCAIETFFNWKLSQEKTAVNAILQTQDALKPFTDKY